MIMPHPSLKALRAFHCIHKKNAHNHTLHTKTIFSNKYISDKTEKPSQLKYKFMSRQLHKHLPCFTYHQSKYYFVHRNTGNSSSKGNHHDIGSFHNIINTIQVSTFSTSELK